MYRKRLTEFYKRYNPACLESVDEILEIFQGREEALFHVLEEKYGVQESIDSFQSQRNAIRTSTGSSIRCLEIPDTSHSSKVTTVGSGSCHGLSKCLRPALHVETEEVGHLADTVQAAKSRLKHCDGVGTTFAVEQSGGINLRSVVRDQHLSERLTSCATEKANLRARNHELRKEIVLLQAEKEALRRQNRANEGAMQYLQKLIHEGQMKERRLIEIIAARELEAGSPLHESEFLEIIRNSQQQLAAFYEDKMSFMQFEMERFFAHASECIREKDAIIDALKKEKL